MTSEELQKLSYEELVKLEDELSLEHEISTRWRIRLASGRIIVFVLSAVLWGILCLMWFFLTSLMPKPFQEMTGVLSPIFVFGILFLAIALGDQIWRGLGCTIRMTLRYLLHYWLVVFAAVGSILSFFIKP